MAFDTAAIIEAARQRARQRSSQPDYALLAEFFRRQTMLDAYLLELMPPRMAKWHYSSSKFQVLAKRLYFLLQSLPKPLRPRLPRRRPSPRVIAYATALCQIRWQLELEARLARELEAIRVRLDELARQLSNSTGP